MKKDLGNMRTSFEKNIELNYDQFNSDPFIQFSEWFDIACEQEISEPNGFVLATVNSLGRVRSRTVLLKYFDENGFVFFTNYGSSKSHDLHENNRVSMLFPWFCLERQLIIEGTAERISHAESLKYFLSRPRGSQIGAWVSQQSQVISSRRLLLDKVKQLSQQFTGKDIPLPEFWGGYRIVPNRFEFWQGQADRLHDRIDYQLVGSSWVKKLLAP